MHRSIRISPILPVRMGSRTKTEAVSTREEHLATAALRHVSSVMITSSYGTRNHTSATVRPNHTQSENLLRCCSEAMPSGERHAWYKDHEYHGNDTNDGLGGQVGTFAALLSGALGSLEHELNPEEGSRELRTVICHTHSIGTCSWHRKMVHESLTKCSKPGKQS
ncbi:hypothetical protein MPH_12109 [Macrophomina phaseolina MS6]|uniref:Uncharacterized protein n=1 Tax=Macrophomina phaseolina (strain MS6) TaxID=1126212 RepID=K2R8R9_MACPH|nr:hypothetical protein MPH_12109 [Macrophomina phaseolina MS6]